MRLTTLRIAWRNLGRNPRRTALAVGAVALGQLTLVSVNGLMAGMFETMMQTITGPLVGHVQIHHREWREEQAPDLFVDGVSGVDSAIRSLPGVTRVLPRIFAPALAASGETAGRPADAETALIVGVDVGGESAKGGLLEGVPREGLPGGGGIVLGRALAARLGLTPGSRIAVIGQDADGFPVSDLFTVTAVVRGMTEAVNRMGIVMPLAEAQALLALPDRAHEISVLGTDARAADALAARIAGLPALAGMEVLPWREAAPELVRIIDMKGWMDFIFLAILFVAAAAGIANTTMMSTFERRYEFGMLAALGAGPRRIIRMIALEAVVLGLVGVAAGSALGIAVVLVTGHTGIDYGALSGIRGQEIGYFGINLSYVIYPRFEVRQVLYGVAAVTATAVIASTWPALLVTRLDPARALRT